VFQLVIHIINWTEVFFQRLSRWILESRMEEQAYQLFSEIQTTHWWFVARRIILEDLLKRNLKPAQRLRIADIGCGTGALLPMLAQFGETWGVDDSATAVEMCRRQNFSNVYLDSDPAGVPSQEFRAAGQFDLMTFLDVIEHVDDDVGFLKSYLGQLKPGGLALITVPAFMFLWSDHDRLNHHRRRYTADRLRQVVEHAALAPYKISYFNTYLFPFIALVRLTMRLQNFLRRSLGVKNRQEAHTDFERNIAPLNGLFKMIFSSERFVLRHGSFPVGTSLLCIARKAQPASAPPSQRGFESRV